MWSVFRYNRSISFDRLIAILKPFQYPNIITVPRTMFVLVSMWLLFTFIASMQVYAEKVLSLSVVLFTFCGSCTSTISHVKVYKTVRHHQIAIHVQLQAVQASITQATNMAHLKKSALNTFIVYFAFVACYCPYGVVGLVTHSYPTWRFLARSLVSTIVFINSSLNPILYCWRLREIRVAVLQTCRSLLFCRNNASSRQQMPR